MSAIYDGWSHGKIMAEIDGIQTQITQIQGSIVVLRGQLAQHIDEENNRVRLQIQQEVYAKKMEQLRLLYMAREAKRKQWPQWKLQAAALIFLAIALSILVPLYLYFHFT